MASLQWKLTWSHLERLCVEPLVSNAAFCVCLGGTGRLSCVNPFSILHRGVVFFGFQKNKLSGNDFSVGFFFFVLPKVLPHSVQRIRCKSSIKVLRHPAMWRVQSINRRCVSDDVLYVCVRAHVRACMPPCAPVICLAPLAGNLSIEIRKKNTTEECLWLSQRGIYNGLQAALTCPCLSLADSFSHTHKHT